MIIVLRFLKQENTFYLPMSRITFERVIAYDALHTVRVIDSPELKSFTKKKDSYYPTKSALPTNPFLKNKIK